MSPGRRGRPRAVALTHMVVMKELSAAMRQLRSAAGCERLEEAVEVLNAAIAELYPDLDPARPAGSTLSLPHPVTVGYVSGIETGNTTKAPIPAWLRSVGAYQREQLRGSQVPAWLVHAYDVAFLADGYLVDMYRWAVSLQADQSGDPPRAPAHARLAQIGPDGFDAEVAMFLDGPEHMRAAVHDMRAAIRRYPSMPATASDWLPDHEDRCNNVVNRERDLPEGVVVAPRTYVLGWWRLRNTGVRPWANKVFYRAGGGDAGLRTPPFVPVPDAPPGGEVDIAVPIQAPSRPGTYRLCLRLGWPNGVYCYPSTLVGAIMSLIVLPDRYAGCETPWRTT
ncbi:NBR1-Ig-like domain-containing protein [Lentzea sp. NBC_00516]|uniref:NBR1-Ig-like domain-containing protein n=1 Tax=Lentzea sp. NBC_00516 TaxID=2903582 RepID=UPI002E7FFCF2|nr:NBR1-Ig-like domain-containing protein [Lentzea sp. NBC_00516]WUD29283.1 NBR1-Ig-like domain-containing protein [Lentzea sp. NBC_00516]